MIIPGPIDRVSDFEAHEVPRLSSFAGGKGVGGVVELSRSAESSLLEISDSPAKSSRGRRGSILICYHPHERWGKEIPSAPSRRRAPSLEDREEEEKASPGFRWSLDREVCFLCTSRVSPLLGAQLVGDKSHEGSDCHMRLTILRRSFFGREDDQAGNMSGSKGEEALAEYKRALEVMSAKKTAPKKAVLSENDDEVQFIKGNKRQAALALTSSLKKKSKASGSTPRVSLSSSSDPATVLANLNTKVFPLTPVVLPERDSSASIQFIQGDLLQEMSQLFHLGERMGDHASLKADLAELTSQLREEKDNVLAKEKETKTLKLKMRNQDEAAENISLREQLEHREEEVCDLRCAAETFDVEKIMARRHSGGLLGANEGVAQSSDRQLGSEGALELYKMVNTSEAEYRGLPAPSFEGEPVIPSRTAIEKTLDPTADDPPSDP
ncbi:LOW QUALITY PROTEIN: hypothetical protein HID58_055401 [Brassica napus]|uniref:Uncharacterized protein n=1 Tax=Brassica napus TaxID=3708 RepID=A0ABQ8AL62_BRANA|nr:LOW QUALITY PROTEIN: hypothetical protein HID58_055401 [Brassica napus]